VLRARGPFKVRQVKAFENLRRELERLKAQDVQITCNLPTGSRGQFLVDEGRLADPGVAVYFTMNGKSMCFACDRYIDVGHNAHAIALTIEAIRGIDRWGSSQMRDRAFGGFAALPPPAPARSSRHWRTVLQVGDRHVTLDEVVKKHRELAFHAHPDRGGDHDAMTYLNQALTEAKQELAAA
jgi:hypothetical protein